MQLNDFFQSIPKRFEPLFETSDNLWNILDNLKDFIQHTIKPNLPECIIPGVPLPDHVVLLPNGWLDEGFHVVCNAQTKGRLQVWIEGEPVPEASLLCAGSFFADSNIEIGLGVVVEPNTVIKGPAIIGDMSEVRHGAYIRGDSIFCKKCVIGHTTEVKHSIFLDNAKAGHFAYLGDSILGSNVNLGAGTKLANLQFATGSVVVNIKGKIIDTKRRKLGAILGDDVQTGCNSVINPGSFLARGCLVAPTVSVRPGFYSPGTFIRG